MGSSAGGIPIIGNFLSGMGTGLSAAAQRAQGRQARMAADNEALQLDQSAGQAQAASQRGAEEERRRAQYAMSRAQAVAGASGAGATDPTVTSIIARIAGEGEYRALTDIYQGEDAARKLRYRGEMARWGGRNAERSGNLNSIATVLRGSSSFFSKYGDGGPPGMSGGSGPVGNNEAGGFGETNPYDYFGAGP